MTQFGPTADDLPPAVRPDHRARSSPTRRSTRRRSPSAATRSSSATAIRLPAGKVGAALADGDYTHRHPPASHHAGRARTAAPRSKGACSSPSSAGRRASSISTSTARPGCRSRTAFIPSRWDRSRSSMSMSTRASSSTRDGRFVAGGAYGQDHARGSPPQLRRRSARRGRLGAEEALLDLADGGAYALLGPSGCGKTTLLNLISGLFGRPRAGSCSTAAT